MRISDWSSDVCSPDLLPPTGTAVLNADDERVVAMRAVTSAEVVTYGTAGDVTATDIVLDEALQGRYRLRSPWGDVDVALAVRGRHQIDNSLAAAAAALVCGVDVDRSEEHTSELP